MRRRKSLIALAVFLAATPAAAGPPYLTDDPMPTDLAHWELYAFTLAAGHRGVFDDDSGLDINYGGFKDVQLTATVPITTSRDEVGKLRSGTGDLELAVKYRFIHDQKSGVSAAVFPRAILPTSSRDHDEKMRLLLPVWVQKDFAGGTSLFGGGGYEINPGPGNRNFWQVGAALTRDLNDTLSVGAELTRQGPDSDDATAQTSAGLGAILKLSEHHALLVSAGPTWADHQTSYHVYASIGLNF